MSRPQSSDVEEVSSQRIATVERAADVLVYFANSRARDHGVTEIADALEIPKATVHRVLASLRSKGFVAFDAVTRRYSLGVTSMKLGLAYLEGLDVRRLGHEELVALSQTTDETATLSMRTGWTRAYVDQVTPNREVIMAVSLGEAFPLHAGASSKAFLAFLPDDELERYLAQPELVRLTGDTLNEPPALRAEVAKIRSDGYARSFAERKSGAASVAAPVFDHNGVAVAVISVCGPIERFRPVVKVCAKQLVAATTRLSHRLGYAADLTGS